MNDVPWLNNAMALAESFNVTIVIIIALILDCLFGEPSRFHPLIGFGNIANRIEKKLNGATNEPQHSNWRSMVFGGLSWLVLVAPLPILIYVIDAQLSLFFQIIFEAILLYLVIGLTSLKQHALQIFKPLCDNDMTLARHFTSYLVSRDTNELSAQQMSRATVESMLENGHDAVIASLFYYAVGGIELAVIHRLANTLDAMWGYKNSRFLYFGRWAARMDDLLGFMSSKVTTLCYALQGNVIMSIKNAATQGNQYKSHNGGWAMAAGATALNIQLGGRAIYHGKVTESVSLGGGNEVSKNDIVRSVKLVQRATLILLVAVLSYQVCVY